MKDSQAFLTKAAITIALTLLGAILISHTQQYTFANPTGRHCVDVGPPNEEQDPNWCGCTWGTVFVDGKPALGAEITLSLNGKQLERMVDIHSGEAYPFYSLRASQIDAKYGDMVTITASFLHQTLTRSVRLTPNLEGEQQLNFAFPVTPLPNNPPTVTILSLPSVIQANQNITLSAVAIHATPLPNVQIVAYEWRSDKDGALGSENTTILRAGLLSAGTHIISIRAQDTRGVWSATQTQTIVVEEKKLSSPILRPQAYLPLMAN